MASITRTTTVTEAPAPQVTLHLAVPVVESILTALHQSPHLNEAARQALHEWETLPGRHSDRGYALLYLSVIRPLYTLHKNHRQALREIHEEFGAPLQRFVTPGQEWNYDMAVLVEQVDQLALTVRERTNAATAQMEEEFNRLKAEVLQISQERRGMSEQDEERARALHARIAALQKEGQAHSLRSVALGEKLEKEQQEVKQL